MDWAKKQVGLGQGEQADWDRGCRDIVSGSRNWPRGARTEPGGTGGQSLEQSDQVRSRKLS